jgi:hypothetical protein
MLKSILSEEHLKEKEMLKNEFEKIFNKYNWVEAITDEEYIREYRVQYSIFLETYSLFKR